MITIQRLRRSPSRTRRAVQCQGRPADLVPGTPSTSLSGTSD